MSKLYLFLCFLWVGNAFAQMPLDSLALSEQAEFTNLEEATANPEKVYRLNLSQANLTAFPANLEQFKNLQVLHLGTHTNSEGYFEKGNNKIKQIPESISKLKNLQHLSLSDNLIEALPEAICDLPNLEYTQQTAPTAYGFGQAEKTKNIVVV
ncbi:MAG: leucine-rich repeat domain-containing protein [Bacteroidetes bacterium]|nr:MAG: leucine-rich repeat domain-containing protein [Bacteroidota bacterium]